MSRISKISKLIIALSISLSALVCTGAYAEDEDWTPADGARSTTESTTENSEADTAESEAPTSPTISIKPTSKDLVFSADQVIDNTFTISNPGATAYDFKVYVEPYTIDDSNDLYTFSFNTSDNHSHIASWVSFKDDSGNFVDSTTFHIEPGEVKTVVYRVSTPSDIPAGGQYAAIFAETVNSEIGKTNINGIYTISRVVLLLYGRSTEGVVLESSISDYNVKSFMTSGKISASSRVHSSGNSYITATHELIVRDIFGNKLYSEKIPYPVLPDTTRYVAMTWEDTPTFGLFSVRYSVTTTDSKEDRVTIVLIMPIWLSVIAILLLTILTIWIIIGVKKRKERKSRLIV